MLPKPCICCSSYLVYYYKRFATIKQIAVSRDDIIIALLLIMPEKFLYRIRHVGLNLLYIYNSSIRRSCIKYFGCAGFKIKIKNYAYIFT